MDKLIMYTIGLSTNWIIYFPSQIYATESGMLIRFVSRSSFRATSHHLSFWSASSIATLICVSKFILIFKFMTWLPSSPVSWLQWRTTVRRKTHSDTYCDADPLIIQVIWLAVFAISVRCEYKSHFTRPYPLILFIQLFPTPSWLGGLRRTGDLFIG
jgi:hypothetical protein